MNCVCLWMVRSERPRGRWKTQADPRATPHEQNVSVLRARPMGQARRPKLPVHLRHSPVAVHRRNFCTFRSSRPLGRLCPRCRRDRQRLRPTEPRLRRRLACPARQPAAAGDQPAGCGTGTFGQAPHTMDPCGRKQEAEPAGLVLKSRLRRSAAAAQPALLNLQFWSGPRAAFHVKQAVRLPPVARTSRSKRH